MQALEWKTSCGCAKCRPALNYYLLATWPGEYVDDGQSRFINERVHANIQKDGTYSVVPRMWGGVTSAAELRAIADVVDKFAIPTVKVTGGQRIDLAGRPQGAASRRLGRPQRRGPRLRRGLRQGAAHGEDLRRLGLVPLRHAGFHRPRDQAGKVPVGLVDAGQGEDGRLRLPTQLRRGDLQGRRRDLRRQRLRHRVRRRRRARHQGDGGALPCRRARRRRSKSSPPSSSSIASRGAISNASTNGRSGSASSSIKAQVVDDLDKRRALYDRFVFSQTFAQIDPWSERVAGKDAHEFAPIADLALAAE